MHWFQTQPSRTVKGSPPATLAPALQFLRVQPSHPLASRPDTEGARSFGPIPIAEATDALKHITRHRTGSRLLHNYKPR